MNLPRRSFSTSRREFLRRGLCAVGVSAGLPALFQQVCRAETLRALDGGGDERHPDRILVVLELGGGNDGLNTVVPYADDAYHRARPKLALRGNKVLKLDDRFGLHPACAGLERLFKDGELAIVHGCGYPNPNLSHFTAMEWWHTALPHGNDPYGWLGRFADARWPQPRENLLVNIASRQSRAVAGARHSPVVFDDPRKFGRLGTDAQQRVFETFGIPYPTENPALDFVNRAAKAASGGAGKIRHACAEYRTLVDYGSENHLTLDLKKTAAMIAAGLPTRVFYLSQGGFDTHAAQTAAQQLLLVYLADALRGFMDDMKRIGRADDVVVMVFTEFGRRVRENASGGTDHGTAAPMFVLGKPVRGGFHGTAPSLEDLDDGNLRMTTDFRSVYGSILDGWMGFPDTASVIKGSFPQVPLFG